MKFQDIIAKHSASCSRSRSAADKEGQLAGELAAVRSLYKSTFPQVREEVVAENDANQELLLAGVQGQRWLDLFD